AGDREFVFRHVLTRDVAYEGIPRRDRGGAHERVARWIEETAGDRRAEFADLIAHHYLQAFRAAEQDPRAVTTATEELRGAAFANLVAPSQASLARSAVPAAERTAQAAFDIARGPLERSQALEALGLMYQLDYRGDLAWRHLRDAVDERIAAEPT